MSTAEAVNETETTTELAIVIEGKIMQSNFSEWKETLLAAVAASNRDLVNDDDFATAEIDVKNLKASEESLQAAKIKALDQAAEINQLFADIDEVSDKAREARLHLEKQIKLRKESIRSELVEAGIQVVEKHLDSMSPILVAREGGKFLGQATEQIPNATKGKRKLDTMRDAIQSVVEAIIKSMADRDLVISRNVDLIEAYSEKYPALFHDQEALACLTTDELKVQLQARIEAFKKQQEKEDAAAAKVQKAQENELELRRELGDKAAEQQPVSATEAAVKQDVPAETPAPVVSSGGSGRVSQPDSNAAKYQITIMLTATQASATARAKAIKEQCGDSIDSIRLFKTADAAAFVS